MDLATTVPNGHIPATPLIQEEKDVLIRFYKQTILVYKFMIVIFAALFFLVIPLLVVYGLLVALKKLQQRCNEIENGSTPVYKVTGTLGRKKVGLWTSGITFMIGDFMLPDSLPPKIGGIEKYRGQTITVEYMPTIARTRCYYAPDGTGYNFLTKKSF